MWLKIIKSLFRGKTFVRSLMNHEFTYITLQGKVLDIGGGENPSYFHFFKKDKDFELYTVDLEKLDKEGHQVDLETDALPYEDNNFDNVLIINFLEHIYNYQFVLKEAYRVLRKGGDIIGFVPFLVNVHPDPHDYFRYTRESLSRIFKDAGFGDIKIKTIGYGPFAVNFNNATTLLPGFITVWVLPFALLVDSIILKLRPHWNERFPLGYLFTMKK